jgi:NADH-quinone oxidoreductase subunit N
MSNLVLALPELFLALAAMLVLLVGVYRGGNPTRLACWLSVLVLAITMILVASVRPAGAALAFNGLFIVDRFAAFLKLLALLGALLSIIVSFGYIRREAMERFEYPVLMLFATLGMMMMLSANDLIALYVGYELMSLSLYVVAAFRRDNLRSTEAGLKYFVLGALSSGMLLYGASLVYGFAGTTRFPGLAEAMTGTAAPPVGLIIGIVFLIAGLAFKVSAVPFHMWTPDVYEGSPTPVTAFFAVAVKIAAIGLFVRVMVSPFGALLAQWQQIIVFVAIASMILGALAAINQSSIKRLMAYSAIGNIGYALVGLAAGSRQGVVGVLVYMAIYLFMTIGTFACILGMRRKGRMVEGIADLAGLSRTHPMMAAAFAVFMFSMAGIPPLAGFFAKLYVFAAAINAHLYWLAVIGVVTSVVAAYYYVRIVKVMYFDEPAEAFDRPVGWENSLVMAGAGLVILLFVLAPGLIVDGAGAAAASLFPG